MWVSFEEELATVLKEFDSSISMIMEQKWCFTASHHVQPPENYVRPGGKSEHGYRSEYTNIQSSQDVVDHGEMKKCKSFREASLYSRQVNYINHTLTHRCQPYFLRDFKCPQIFDPNKHEATDPNRFVSNSVEIISICEKNAE